MFQVKQELGKSENLYIVTLCLQDVGQNADDGPGFVRHRRDEHHGLPQRLLTLRLPPVRRGQKGQRCQ